MTHDRLTAERQARWIIKAMLVALRALKRMDYGNAKHEMFGGPPEIHAAAKEAEAWLITNRPSMAPAPTYSEMEGWAAAAAEQASLTFDGRPE